MPSNTGRRAHVALAVEALDHDVRYTLFDVSSGVVRWQRTAVGRYYRREPVVSFTPHEDDPTFFSPSSLGPVFADQFEFARGLNRALLRSLPSP